MRMPWKKWGQSWRSGLAMSGTDRGFGSQDEQNLLEVLARQSSTDSLSALVSALKSEVSTFALADTAIGLDSSVFLRFGNNSNNEDMLDYLGSKHSAPLILPGQAVQEFWNNQLQVVDTISTNIKKKFDAFQSELKKSDPFFEPYANKINEILEEYRGQHGHIYDEMTVRKTIAVLELLQQRALVPYAPRLKLREIAAWRKKTRTPPGFKDEGDGDFFIWADFLAGLQLARANGESFSRAILVTRDNKIDWSRSGMAHPILTAEIKALLGVPFEIWTDQKLSVEISKALTE
jgi:PIN domain-containing protein